MMKRDSGEVSPVGKIEDKDQGTFTYPVGSAGSETDYGFTPEEEKRIIWRIDRRLVPVLGIMYCVSLMDRTNLGAANIAGMGTELLLIGERYVSRGLFSRPASRTFLRRNTDQIKKRPSSHSFSSSPTSSSNLHRPSLCAPLARGSISRR